MTWRSEDQKNDWGKTRQESGFLGAKDSNAISKEIHWERCCYLRVAKKKDSLDEFLAD